MPTKDLDRARHRLLHALQRTLRGLDLQKRRIAEGRAAAPEIIPGVSDLRGEHDGANDADYYVYEMGRLHAIARATSGAFGKPPALVDALAAFDDAVPGLKELRDPLTHPADNDKLDNLHHAGGHFELVDFHLGRGSVRYPVDSRYQHHDAAIALGDVLLSWLDPSAQTSVAST